EDDDDSERDMLIHEELLDNYSLSLPVIESFYFDIPSFFRPLAKPPDGNTEILNIKMMGDISDQKVHMPKLMITLVSNQEKSPDLLSHRGLEIFKLSDKCPMMIRGKNIPILDVPLFHFTPLISLSMGELVKDYQEKDKIGSKPDKNGKRGEAGKSQKQLQSREQEKLKKMQVEGPKVQTPTKLLKKEERKGLKMQLHQCTTTRAKTANNPKLLRNRLGSNFGAVAGEAWFEFGQNWKNQHFGYRVDTEKFREIPHNNHNKDNLVTHVDNNYHHSSDCNLVPVHRQTGTVVDNHNHHVNYFHLNCTSNSCPEVVETPTHADLLLPCKRFRDSYSPEDSREEHMEIGIADAEVVVFREDEEEFELEASTRCTMEIVVDPLVTGDISESTGGDVVDLEGTLYDIVHYMSEVPLDMTTEFETAQRQLEVGQLMASGERGGLANRFRMLGRENQRVRPLLSS
nr:hypothetical protein [Tanacetum cinerariifolium]